MAVEVVPRGVPQDDWDLLGFVLVPLGYLRHALFHRGEYSAIVVGTAVGLVSQGAGSQARAVAGASSRGGIGVSRSLEDRGTPLIGAGRAGPTTGAASPPRSGPARRSSVRAGLARCRGGIRCLSDQDDPTQFLATERNSRLAGDFD